MTSIMVPTKLDWSGLVLSIQNLSYNSEFVHLPSWYRPLLDCLIAITILCGMVVCFSMFSLFIVLWLVLWSMQ